MKKAATPKTKSAELGEHKIIQLLQKHLTTMPDIAMGFGDDVSAINLNSTQVAVLKTDMLIAETDVPQTMSLYQAAHKAIIMNVSDFASKGVQPRAAMVALGLPRGVIKQDVEEIARGLDDAAREYDAYVVGGDTNEASDLTIAVMLYGVAEKSKLMPRGGAKAGDILAVTGEFGNPSAGLYALMHGLKAQGMVVGERLLEAVFLPKARLAEGLALAESGAVGASIDSSDGLASSIHELARQSGIGFIVNRAPVAKDAAGFARTNGLDPFDLAFYGGEEYELVLTIKPEKWTRAEAAVKALGGQLLPIGKAVENKEIIFEVNGKKRTIEERGWEHFKSQV